MHSKVQGHFSTLKSPRKLETVSVIGLEFFSPLEFGFPGALHLQSTVELVLQHPSHVKMVMKNPM